MTTYTLFGQSGGSTLVSDGNPYTMGVQFSVSQAGCMLTGMWWFSPSGAGALPGTIALFAVSGGTLVHSETPSWSGVAGSGWVRAAFASPPSLAASTGYVAAILQSLGTDFYSATAHYWDSGPGSGGITNGPLSAPGNAGAANGQGVFNAGGTLTFPATSFNATNYWPDPEITAPGVARTRTASLLVTPALSASRTAARSRTATLAAAPVFAAAHSGGAGGKFTLPGVAVPGSAVPGAMEPGQPRAAVNTSAPAIIFQPGVPYFRWATGTPYLS